MSIKNIDLNCDLGEWREANGTEKDAKIMPYITSCNIACGGHIGDEESMRKTIHLAKKHGVKIGAHPAYPDMVNFGREVLVMPPDHLELTIKSQIQLFKELLDEAGEPLHHIKPHGALYNHAAQDKETAYSIVKVIKSLFENEVPLYAQQNSVLAEVAEEAGLKVVYEVFADRAYEDDLSLRSRKLDGAVLYNTSEVLQQVENMVVKGTVNTHSGETKLITPQTVCLHSDTEGSIELAKEIHQFLESKDVEITAP